MRRIEAKLDSLNSKNLSAPIQNFEEDNHQVQERRVEGRKQSQGNQEFRRIRPWSGPKEQERRYTYNSTFPSYL